MVTLLPANKLPPPYGLQVEVDPRIELLAVVQYLSGYDSLCHLLTRFDIQYKNDIELVFHSFRQHQVVKLFDHMSSDRFNFHTPPQSMLYLSDLPELENRHHYPEDLIERADGAVQLGQFLSALGQSTKETRFMDFYESQSVFYEGMINETVTQLSRENDLVAVLESYFGMK